MEYKTSDLPLAAYLVLHKIKLKEMQGKEGDRRRYFVFEKTDELEFLVERYMNGEAVGNIKDYFYVLKDLKTRIYNE
jgi:hypothetical protein